jgi:CubicO group peptidase (beta-lactamase class C family)
MAVPYGYNNLLRQPRTYGFYGYPTYPDGALKTSVNEFARFLSVFINEGKTFEGKPFLKAETVKEMLNLHQFPGLDVQDSVGLAWHSRGGFYYHTGGDPGMTTMTIFNPSTNQGCVLFTNGGDNLDILAQARQDFIANEAMTLLMTRMTAPWFFSK